jgi:hypothetical protein
MIDNNGFTIFVTAVRATAWSGNIGLPPRFTSLMDGTARRKRTVLISFGSPYLISQVPSIGSYILGWQSRGMSERAMAAALSGAAPITGRLPISIPGGGPYGHGIVRTRVSDPRAPR